LFSFACWIKLITLSF